MGLFFYTKKGSIISTVDLPTTEIIEPKFKPETVKERIIALFFEIFHRLLFHRSHFMVE